MPRNFDEIQARVMAGETISDIAATEGVTKQALSKWLKEHATKRRTADVARKAGAAAEKAVAKVIAKEMRT